MNSVYSMSSIDRELMWRIAEGKPLTQTELTQILQAQCQYLAQMVNPGRWQTLLAGGIVFAIMEGAPQPPAKLECRKIEGLNLCELDLPWSSWIGSTCRGQDLSKANLSCSLLCDCDFTGSSFEGATLSYADLSRAVFHKCNFRGAHLVCADLENIDFTGADMRGVELEAVKNADKAKGLHLGGNQDLSS